MSYTLHLLYLCMNKFVLLVFAALCSVAACNQQAGNQQGRQSVGFQSIDPGTLVNQGDSISLRLNLPADTLFDSIVYQLNGKPYHTITDSSDVWLATKGMAM